MILPLPLSFTGCGSCSALSMIVRVALYGCAAVGLNVTPIVHFAAGASGASQPFVALYGLTAPLDPSINTVRPGFFLLPLGLLTVMFFGPLDEPTVTVPKFSDAGLIFSLTSTGVGVAVGVAAAVGVGVVAVAVAVGVEVAVAVAVGVGVVTVAVAVGVEVAVAVALGVAVAVAVSVAVAVAVRVAAAVGVNVAVAVGVGAMYT